VSPRCQTRPRRGQTLKLVDATMRRVGQHSRGPIETLHTVQEARLTSLPCGTWQALRAEPRLRGGNVLSLLHPQAGRAQLRDLLRAPCYIKAGCNCSKPRSTTCRSSRAQPPTAPPVTRAVSDQRSWRQPWFTIRTFRAKYPPALHEHLQHWAHHDN
jgi:hypothetical protein